MEKNKTSLQAEKKKTGVYKNLLTGGISASIARTLTNPIERVEILRQVENTDYKGLNFPKSVVKFYRTQGISGLFKGNSASIARIFPFSALEFYSFEFSKNIIIRGYNNRTNSLFHTMICGGLAAFNAITLTFPLEVARTRLAINTENSLIKESSLIKTIKNLWINEGIRGLYKGYSLSCIGSMPGIAIKQTSFEFMKNNFMIPKYRNTLNFLFGSMSGIIVTVIVYPPYMIKRVLQANNDPNFKLLSYMKDLAKRKGFNGFYSGMSMTLLKVIPDQGLLFLCNEQLKSLLKY